MEKSRPKIDKHTEGCPPSTFFRGNEKMFKTYKEYIDWAEKRHRELLKEHDEELKKFKSIQTETCSDIHRMDDFNKVCADEFKLKEELYFQAMDEMYNLPGCTEIMKKEEIEFIFNSGAMDTVRHEYQTLDKAHVVEKDKNGDTVLEYWYTPPTPTFTFKD